MIQSHSQINNTSGNTGVYWNKIQKQWFARIYINKKMIHLGYYDKKSDAIKARKDAEKKYMPKNISNFLTLRSLCKIFDLRYITAKNSIYKKIKADKIIGTTNYYSLVTVNKIFECFQKDDLITISDFCFRTSNSQSKFTKNIAGIKYGRLTAIKMLEEKTSKGGAIWVWQCDCGKMVIIPYHNVAHTNSRDKKSCGCIRKEQYAKLNKFLGVTNIEGTCVERILSTNLSRRNKSGVKGVFWDKSRKMWHAKIMFQKKEYDLGRYSDKEQAIKVRKQAEKKLYSPFLKWYDEYIKNKKSLKKIAPMHICRT